MTALKESFSIKANTYTLFKSNIDENLLALISAPNKFVIPIFQRPYSWEGRIVSKFIKDIVDSYLSVKLNLSDGNLFIGTMQVREESGFYEIIDGQQRISTLLLLLKVLSQHVEKIPMDWLSTNVNNGAQQNSLNVALNHDFTLHKEGVKANLYLENLLSIQEQVDEFLSPDEYQSFFDYLKGHIYFVVIQTQAGLSKILKIFDTINTTGLDLNGSDIFKIRMYEYLTIVKKQNKDVFDNISKLYKQLEEANKRRKEEIKFIEILRLYQYFLITKFDLPNTLYHLNTNTFFERLFDTIFKLEEWPNFNKSVNVVLHLEDIEQLLESRLEWSNLVYKKPDTYPLINFIWWSRYSKYWILIIIYFNQFKNQENYMNDLEGFISQLSKVYIIYSIRYQRSINEVSNLTYQLLKAIIKTDRSRINSLLSNKIKENAESEDLKWKCSFNLTENAKRKNILCRLIAILYELENNQQFDKKLIDEILWGKIDIEHIQSYNDHDKSERDKIKRKWGNELNGHGNLVILESQKNKSIGNKPFQVKLKAYKSSQFSIVSQEVTKNEEWTKEHAIIRRERIESSIMKYFLANNVK